MQLISIVEQINVLFTVVVVFILCNFLVFYCNIFFIIFNEKKYAGKLRMSKEQQCRYHTCK